MINDMAEWDLDKLCEDKLQNTEMCIKQYLLC